MGTDIKFKMNARPQDHFHTSHIWQNFPYTCTFWNCVCKNSETFPIFFKFGRNFDAQILKKGKIQRKLKIKQTLVLFCEYLRNASFDLYEIWYVYSWDSKELSNDFSSRSVHTHAHKRRKCARAHFVAMKRACARLLLLWAHVCTDVYEKSVANSLLSCE